ncbi:MAG: hypothetical protein EA384_11355 [Spirochaetaceae bacterium]|nr:MAG: hypothetical protein EA384_11355 [Spirochaetaceae bacterium]
MPCALLHEQAVLFLDEPTSGVDPVALSSFWDLIDSLAAGGITVLVTTHYLHEAEYCNDRAMMHAGRIIATGSSRAIKERIPAPQDLKDTVPTMEDVFIALRERAEDRVQPTKGVDR